MFIFEKEVGYMMICFRFQDNVFVTVVASIQYRALAEKASDAFYKLTNTRTQIQAYVFDGMKTMKSLKRLIVYFHWLISDS